MIATCKSTARLTVACFTSSKSETRPEVSQEGKEIHSTEHTYYIRFQPVMKSCVALAGTIVDISVGRLLVAARGAGVGASSATSGAKVTNSALGR